MSTQKEFVASLIREAAPILAGVIVREEKADPVREYMVVAYELPKAGEMLALKSPGEDWELDSYSNSIDGTRLLAVWTRLVEPNTDDRPTSPSSAAPSDFPPPQ